MIALGNRRLWLCGEPVDMRKGIDGLITVVQQRLLREVMTGEVFLFVGRDPSRLKILCWDGDGYWLATKRLSQGRFQVPRAVGKNGVATAIELTHRVAAHPRWHCGARPHGAGAPWSLSRC